MKKSASIFCVMLLCFQMMKAQSPKPTKAQLEWHDMGYYLFAHFGPNTFTDKEWGHGDEAANIFNPESLDCKQWCRIAKQAGAKGIIITAKHHDGFCLWPSKYSTHTVKQSKWRDGNGDVLKELSEACKLYGLKFGVYISPWDRNHPDYGTDKYNDVFVKMMEEIFTSYGPIWELWWDGANGEGPNGKRQVYDWHRFEQTVRKLSPNTVIFSDIGPDIRWVGNEKGIAAKTNWNYLDTAGFNRGLGAPPNDTLQQGNVNGRLWLPAECDVSIRPGWFYHKEEDEKVKTPEQLFDLYLKSVGRGATLLLNVPPDRRGLIHEKDSISLTGFRKLRDESFNVNLSLKATAMLVAGDVNKKALVNDNDPQTFVELKNLDKEYLQVRFKTPQKINAILLKETIKDGQAVSNFEITLNGPDKTESINGTTIGHTRIITFPARSVNEILINFKSAKNKIKIVEVQSYLLSEQLVEK